MKLFPSSLAVIALLSPTLLCAQTATSASERGVEIETVIQSVAKKTGKVFIVDPRVRAQVTIIGANATSGDYAQLLSVLEVHGFAAVEVGNAVHVVPEANARQLATPLVSGKKFSPSEMVTETITIKSIPAAQLIPMLRPMLPQFAHFAALPCNNTILIVDRYANVKRIHSVIEALDQGAPLKPRECVPPTDSK